MTTSRFYHDIANNSRQISSYYTTTATTRQAFEDAQRVETAHYASLPRPKDHRLSVSILLPPNSTAAATALEAAAAVPNLQRSWSPESSQSKEASESAGSDGSLESNETDLFDAHPFHHSGDQPTLSSSLHNPPASSSSMRPVAVSNSSSAAVAAAVESYQMMNFEPSQNHHHHHHHHHYTPEKQYEMSGEVTQMLQDLESALLEDDDDDNLPSSFYQQHCGITTTSERSFWADAAFDVDMLHDAVPENTTNGIEDSAQPGVEVPPETRRLERLLVACAEAVGENDFTQASALITTLKQVVSIVGDPMQRLAAYMVEGLVAKMVSSGGNIYRTLKCKEPLVGDFLSAMQVLYQVCPYFKFGYMAANGAIAEAFQNEERVHIVDFEINQGIQWCTLIQALAERPGGPPHLRITGVEDPPSSSSEFMSTHPTAGAGGGGGGLESVGDRLRKLAQSVGVPFVFHAVEKKGPEVQAWMLEQQHGEALAVNFALQLHHMPDESVCMMNPRDRLLQMVKGLNPKVVTIVEQEANTNTAPFLPRFIEAMNYYSAVFQSLDITLPRESRDRINVEQQCLARDIVNVIACEGAERVERHEMLGKWRSRMTMAGFRPHPLSSAVNHTIKLLLKAYSNNYKLKEEEGALFLGWMNRSLIVASAWH
ncbi:unnamed protein product [Sphagnum troendelagicum]|uniref:Uncharacterized protein n=1 Tax=Sphagnum troendelagicum TaxID=128251 RepID=A0ABP0UCK8_9BRYO